jgi:hypothetical protein
MIIMSLQGASVATQLPVTRGDCFAAARNDVLAKVNVLPALCSSGCLQSASGVALSALMPSSLDRAFKGEL